MKIFSIVTLGLMMALVQVRGQMPNSNPVQIDTVPYQVDAGANYRVWQSQGQNMLPSGQVITNIHKYTELASGLNYQNPNGEWLASEALIESFSGGAVAQHGQHKVIFADNLNSPEAIDMQTSDGKRLRSNILGLMYVDTTTGQAELIAQLHDSEGELVSQNQVLYPNAFDGVAADVLFTYRRDGMEQDVILREQPPAPELFGMDSASVELEVFTEFIDPPAADVVVTETNVQTGELDQSVSWGASKLGRGKAFSLDGKDSPAGVFKRYMTIQGRHFLVEKVLFRDIQPALSDLPEQASNAHGIPGMASTSLPLPKAAAAKSASRPMRLALGKLPDKGYVLDYITVSSAYTNYTFQGDSTYYISGTLTLSGTNTFEGGAVIKYATNASISVSALNWLAAPYRPVVFTSKDDDSVGESISGSTGTPTNYFANPALSLWPSVAPTPTLSNFRISCAKQAVSLVSVGLNLYNGQIVNCLNGINGYVSNGKLRNVLFANVRTNFNQFYIASYDVQNSTFDGSSWLLTIADVAYQTTTLSLTNCILANVTNCQTAGPDPGSYSVTGDFNGFYRSFAFGSDQTTNSTWPFQSVGAGNYYLTNGCNFFNQGTTNIDAALLTSLSKKTTCPPVAYTNITVTDTNWLPTATRDINTPDLGYHYEPIDYAVSYVTVSGTLTLGNGVAVAVFNAPGIYGTTDMGFFMYGDSDQLITTGTAQAHNQFCTYEAVQEQPFNWGGNPPESTFFVLMYGIGYDAPTEWLRARFTDFNGLTGLGSWLWGAHMLYGDMMGLDMRDCRVGPGAFYCSTFGSYDEDIPTNQCVNNLFDRVYLRFDDYDGNSPLVFDNNTFHNGLLSFGLGGSEIWRAQDNLFDHNTFDEYSSTPTICDHNGYVNTSVLAGSGGNDIVLANFSYTNGPLGNFYQASTDLINKGSVTADQRGLYHYTIQTNLVNGLEIKETNSIVDIGFHYVATDSNGAPIDTDGDGVPDYLENSNGDGSYGVGDLSDWLVSPYNGLSRSFGLQVFTPLQ